MKRKCVIAFALLMKGACAGAGDASVADWVGRAPAQIEKIEAPFAMPSLDRPVFRDQVFNVADHGAQGDGITKNTEAFRKAIAACSAAGGGKVLVPKGKWLTGAIHLRSNVNLHMEAGAEIHFSDDPADYLPVVFQRCVKSAGSISHAVDWKMENVTLRSADGKGFKLKNCVNVDAPQAGK
jgi:polygalacturonase